MSDLKVLQKTEALHEARWWEPEGNGRVHCFLCPRHCPHSCRAIGILFHTHQSGREAL